jgi:hypothetical protein
MIKKTIFQIAMLIQKDKIVDIVVMDTSLTASITD